MEQHLAGEFGVGAGAVEVGGDVNAALVGGVGERLPAIVAAVLVPLAVELGIEFHSAVPAAVPLVELIHCFQSKVAG